MDTDRCPLDREPHCRWLLSHFTDEQPRADLSTCIDAAPGPDLGCTDTGSQS